MVASDRLIEINVALVNMNKARVKINEFFVKMNEVSVEVNEALVKMRTETRVKMRTDIPFKKTETLSKTNNVLAWHQVINEQKPLWKWKKTGRKWTKPSENE